MSEKLPLNRAQEQGKKIAALRDATGLSKGALMDALSFKTSRGYDLYETGETILRTDRVEEWAEAFRVTPLAFSAVLYGLMEPPDAIGSIIRERLHGRVPENEIEKLIAAHGRAPVLDQIAIAEDALQATQEMIEMSRPKHNSRSA